MKLTTSRVGMDCPENTVLTTNPFDGETPAEFSTYLERIVDKIQDGSCAKYGGDMWCCMPSETAYAIKLLQSDGERRWVGELASIEDAQEVADRLCEKRKKTFEIWRSWSVEHWSGVMRRMEDKLLYRTHFIGGDGK